MLTQKLWRRSLIMVFPVYYFDENFVNSSYGNKILFKTERNKNQENRIAHCHWNNSFTWSARGGVYSKVVVTEFILSDCTIIDMRGGWVEPIPRGSPVGVNDCFLSSGTYCIWFRGLHSFWYIKPLRTGGDGAYPWRITSKDHNSRIIIRP